MVTYRFKVTCTDGKQRTLTTTSERLEQATSNILAALLTDGHDPVSWAHEVIKEQVSGS